MSDLDFMFNGLPVGIFETAKYPSAPGRYRYMPYRGLGHYNMGRELKQQGTARCYYDAGGNRVSFTVSAIPEYGVLQLQDFKSSSQP